MRVRGGRGRGGRAAAVQFEGWCLTATPRGRITLTIASHASDASPPVLHIVQPHFATTLELHMRHEPLPMAHAHQIFCQLAHAIHCPTAH